MKKILIILDGASDLPVRAFQGETPFERAETPNLDYLTYHGKLGYMYPLSENKVPGSDTSLISLFGNNPANCKRGVYEAIGAGFRLNKGDLAIRINLGTIDNLKNKIVIDRRAGRTITTRESLELLKSLNTKIKIKNKFRFKSTVQHRGVLVIRGKFSDNFTNIDSEWVNPGTKEKSFKFSEPLDNELKTIKAVNLINEIAEQSFKILNNHPINLERKRKGLLPANMIFLRGAGSEKPKIKKYKSWLSINSMPLEIGIAKASGMKNISFKIPDMKSIDVYNHLYTTLNKKIKLTIRTIERNHRNFKGCYIHFKETDIPGHDNKPYEKKNMIELIDKHFFSFIRKFSETYKIKIVITCDHSTPCILKSHSSDPVPVLVYDNGKDRDFTSRFTEHQAEKGKLGKIYGRDFMKITGLDKQS